jgi:DNA-binding NarL/FixJ family response regulator
MKILYVENHAVFASQVCREFLSTHLVKIVPSLAEARAALVADSYELVIVDYDLDDGKGDALVRSCRVLHPELKIIAASSHEAGNSALLKAGASAVCSKMEFDNIGSVITSLGKLS